MKSGIYTITNLTNGKIYIGYATNMYRRRDWHYCSLRAGTHANVHLQAAYNKYGIENMQFEILERADVEFLPSLEHYWCNLVGCHDRLIGYNIRVTHPNNKVPNVSLETRARMRASQLGKVRDREAVEKTRAKNKGQKRDPAQVASRAFKKRTSLKNKHVLQFDKEMNLLVEWNSASEIQRCLGYPNSTISACCSRKRNIAYGFVWQFKDKTKYEDE